MSTTQRSESMNAFFDGYVHSKTSLKQFVEQYERAMRSKVEKEFHADFKSFSQMVPCATKYEMEKQFQEIYTIAKFREFQEEFTGKVYCEVISTQEACVGTYYEVREDVIFHEVLRKKMFTVSFQRDICHIVCSCHLFEFRGILCKHAITVLIRNDIVKLPDAYILRRWRRDVSRAYTRVKINYDGWITNPGQLRYDRLCLAFAKVADLVADDEERSQEIMEWIECQSTDMTIPRSKPSCGSNFLSQHSVQMGSLSTECEKNETVQILDPKFCKTKGAHKKLHRKGPLEERAKKPKVVSKGKKSKTLVQPVMENIGASIQPTIEPYFPISLPNSLPNLIHGKTELITSSKRPVPLTWHFSMKTALFPLLDEKGTSMNRRLSLSYLQIDSSGDNLYKDEGSNGAIFMDSVAKI
ncbi:Protein FAR1-RELATED SEQUENCE [Abeliophyllum distichum]|uniref:Protein FAR1-RELATED SEQUENCE n=1 Tax=Abeliophyllum distichum TaxID=126358 RepID=A0ABD1SXQ8_9LAMI